MTWWLPFLCVFILALILSFLLTPLAARLAKKLNAIDYPSARRINTRPIPRMGGVAIFLAIAGAALLQWWGTTFTAWPVVLVPAADHSINYHIVALGFLFIFLVGSVDDVVQLKPLPKFIGQIIAACIAVSGGLIIGNIVNPFYFLFGSREISLGIFAYPITVIYLVAYTNIINLIDGLDGLATGISYIASSTMFALAILAGRLDAAALSAALAGACLGFLPHNFSPASIFLGDSGSLLLGFSLGTISLLNVTRIAGLTTIIIPLVVAGIPILDTFSAIIRRKRVHVSIGHADTGHLHHRLLAEGFNQRQTVALIYVWTIFLCVGAFIMTQIRVWPRVGVFCFLLIASLLFAKKLGLFHPVLLHHYDSDAEQDVIISKDSPAFSEEEKKQLSSKKKSRQSS